MPSLPRASYLPVPPPATPADTARYTHDLIESLRKLALSHRQTLLAHLLDLAAQEAKYLASQAQETRLPG